MMVTSRRVVDGQLLAVTITRMHGVNRVTGCIGTHREIELFDSDITEDATYELLEQRLKN